MTSVTQRIKEIKQPYGGYLKPSTFQTIKNNDNEELQEENIHSILVGLVVDYLTRFMLGTPIKEAFKISLLGAKIINEEKKAMTLLKNIVGMDSASIYNACKLVGYDVCFRAGPRGYKSVDGINADEKTISNIKIMVKRSIAFFDEYGPITMDGFTFEGGYTDLIHSGDGDFLTNDTLWDFKVSTRKPTSAHTLQLLIYYIMGLHSVYTEFQNIRKLGIFNPRMNTIYLKNVDEISDEIIDEISTEVIGYNKDTRIIKSSKNPIKTDNNKNDVIIPLTDVMKELRCSRHMVMKYYSEQNLPLFKEQNKYYIYESDFMEWSEKRVEEKMQGIKVEEEIQEETQEEAQEKIPLVIIGVAVGLLLLWCLMTAS